MSYLSFARSNYYGVKGPCMADPDRTTRLQDIRVDRCGETVRACQQLLSDDSASSHIWRSVRCFPIPWHIASWVSRETGKNNHHTSYYSSFFIPPRTYLYGPRLLVLLIAGVLHHNTPGIRPAAQHRPTGIVFVSILLVDIGSHWSLVAAPSSEASLSHQAFAYLDEAYLPFLAHHNCMRGLGGEARHSCNEATQPLIFDPIKLVESIDANASLVALTVAIHIVLGLIRSQLMTAHFQATGTCHSHGEINKQT